MSASWAARTSTYQAGGIVDGRVEKLPPNTARPAPAIAVHRMADALNAPKPLHVDVQDVAGVRPAIHIGALVRKTYRP